MESLYPKQQPLPAKTLPAPAPFPPAKAIPLPAPVHVPPVKAMPLPTPIKPFIPPPMLIKTNCAPCPMPAPCPVPVAPIYHAPFPAGSILVLFILLVIITQGPHCAVRPWAAKVCKK